MKQGTISILLGCHSPIHSLLVVRAWHHLYGCWPNYWETGCIFLHDIGHLGKDYLNDVDQKRLHWWLGANIAYKLFGFKGYTMCAGHDAHSQYPLSLMYRADKYSYKYAPYWWLWQNITWEPKLGMGYKTRREAIDKFRKQVDESVDSGEYRSTHDFYLERCKGEAK